MNSKDLAAIIAACFALVACCFFVTKCCAEEAVVVRMYVPRDSVKLEQPKP
jgi:hypothetical protein